MNITSLPFNKHIGLSRSEKEGCLLSLSENPYHLNHLGTFHASALFGLAEAASSEFLIQNRGEHTDLGGVVRRTSGKYALPANGEVHARSLTPISELEEAIGKVDKRGKAMLEIAVELVDAEGKKVATFEFTWHLAKT